MKKLYTLFIFCLISSLSFGQLINEFEPNPIGTDPTDVSFELKGTPSAAFSGWILSIESDAVATSGHVQNATSVMGNFDANGLLVVTIPDLENPSFTIVLVDNFTGTVNITDLDTNDDGVVDDASSFGIVYDAIGIPDNVGDETFLYGADLGGTDFAYTGDEPRIIFRDGSTNALYAVNDVTGDATDEIYDVNGVLVANADFDINPALGTTFGSINSTNTALSSDVFSLKESFKLYPNPNSTRTLYISSPNADIIKVNVFNMLGKQVMNAEISNELNISSLNAGLYMVKLTQGNATITKKLVIK